MTGPLFVHYYPVFEEGIFEKHPALFSRFMQHSPDHLEESYQKARVALTKYEGSITWPLIAGPGFCGATHPGADNIFVTAMASSNARIYNSDCLYINPSQKIFAISDAPGITTSSRKLFVRLDRYLQTGSIDGIENMINDLNRETELDDCATLSLMYFPRDKSNKRSGKALAFIAGDTYLFHGNIFQRRLKCIEGKPEFMGRPHIHFEPERIDLAEGDFFIIASDGIQSIRCNKEETRLEEALLEHIVDGALGEFAFSVIKSCNTVFEERINDRVITRFGGSDNVSALLVYPEDLIDIDSEERLILGGYIADKLS